MKYRKVTWIGNRVSDEDMQRLYRIKQETGKPTKRVDKKGGYSNINTADVDKSEPYFKPFCKDENRGHGHFQKSLSKALRSDYDSFGAGIGMSWPSQSAATFR